MTMTATKPEPSNHEHEGGPLNHEHDKHYDHLACESGQPRHPNAPPPDRNEATSPPTNHPSSRMRYVTTCTPLSIDRNRETCRRRPLGNGVLGKCPSPLLNL